MIDKMINGVSFDEYAAACGMLAKGVSIRDISITLELDDNSLKPVLNKWNEWMIELSGKNKDILSRFRSVFANPKVGRFNGEFVLKSVIDDLIDNEAGYEAYQKIFWHQYVASRYQIDLEFVLQGYKLDMAQWRCLNIYYMNSGINNIDEFAPDYQEKVEYFERLNNYWLNYWEKHYEQFIPISH